MIQIDDKLISEELLTEQFVCNLDKCKGECCVAGDIGAPLDEDETKILEQIYPIVKPYLTAEGIAAIEQQGTWVSNDEDEFATPMMGHGGACVYTIFDNGIAKCGIEKAYLEQKLDWKKPISCHLYPIRISKNKYFEKLNYHRWDICADACKNGKKLKVPVYKFLKEAIERKYGNDFYQQLEATEKYLKKNVD
ncbi:MAG: hypothetical protein RIQ33_153 [Bacteroidota bacterium]|jgi:hypothetical protein